MGFVRQLLLQKVQQHLIGNTSFASLWSINIILNISGEDGIDSALGLLAALLTFLGFINSKRVFDFFSTLTLLLRLCHSFIKFSWTTPCDSLAKLPLHFQRLHFDCQ